MSNWKLLIENLADKITKDIHDEGDDPLDGDDTERLGRLLTLELDKRQGNCTAFEYDQEMHRIEGGLR